MKKTLIIILTLSQTACATLTGESLFVGENEGRFLLSADRAGLQEFGRAMNGLVVTGKAKANEQDSYFANQESETQVRALRFTAKKGGPK